MPVGRLGGCLFGACSAAGPITVSDDNESVEPKEGEQEPWDGETLVVFKGVGPCVYCIGSQAFKDARGESLYAKYRKFPSYSAARFAYDEAVRLGETCPYSKAWDKKTKNGLPPRAVRGWRAAIYADNILYSFRFECAGNIFGAPLSAGTGTNRVFPDTKAPQTASRPPTVPPPIDCTQSTFVRIDLPPAHPHPFASNPNMPKSKPGKKTSQRKKSSSSKTPGQGRCDRPPWARGTKLAFLERWVSEYRKIAGNKGKVNKFYTKIARMFIIKYGYDLPVDQDTTKVLEDPDQAQLDVVSEYANVDNENCCMVPIHIRRLQNLLKASTSDTFTALIEKVVQAPQRGQAIHMYSKRYWSTKIAAHYDKLQGKGVGGNKDGDAHGGDKDSDGHGGDKDDNNKYKEEEGDDEDSRTDGDNGKANDHLQDELWAAETDNVKREMQALVDEAYDIAMEEYRSKFLQMPLTDEEREWTSAHAYMFLQPIVDMVLTRFNCAASLFIAGPVSSKNGHIEVNSTVSHMWLWLTRLIAADILRMAQKSANHSGSAATISDSDAQAQDAPAYDSNAHEASVATPSSSLSTTQHVKVTAKSTSPVHAVSPDTASPPTSAPDASKTNTEHDHFSPRTDISAPSGAAPLTSLTGNSSSLLSFSPAHLSPPALSSSTPPYPTTMSSHDNGSDSKSRPNTESLGPNTQRLLDGTSRAIVLDATSETAAGTNAVTSPGPQTAELSPSTAPINSIERGAHTPNESSSTPTPHDLTTSGAVANAPPAPHTTTLPITAAHNAITHPAVGSIALTAAADIHGAPVAATVASTTAPSSRIPPPADVVASSKSQADRGWPELFDRGVMKFRSAALGPDWQRLVTRFSMFEEALSFGEGPGESLSLGTKHRPEEVRQWQKSRRPWHNGKIQNLDTFMTRCEDWWNALQPAERFNSEGETMVPSASMDWTAVCITSPNGLLSVLAALLWWGLAVKDDQEDYSHECWLNVVVVVSTVLFVTHAGNVARAASMNQEVSGSSKGLKRRAQVLAPGAKSKKRSRK
ncbi:hypothetical protein FA95DRAFT_1577808 [Auriscalpium vulgare]|uniref:Uncharacterized protein n=1 Tax=Auriscalpium vulgare TaxID=40419 RepID=A0ACB8R647_9AGAM|nr:hypothetical protein FA95DRAFT_1577808 [Auriscalpium vulgare]